MIIKALKKSIGIFKREQATEVNWPFIPEDKVECSIDETPIDCKDLQENYTGVPAPEENVIDEWFADRTGEVITEDLTKFVGNYEGPLYAPYTAVDAFKQESTGDDGTHQRCMKWQLSHGILLMSILAVLKTFRKVLVVGTLVLVGVK